MDQESDFPYSTRNIPEALGVSEAFLGFQERLSQVAKVDRPVLLIGERGTGKELAAARLHYLSKRWQGPLVALNCSALAESVLESELFGHEAGAFTGAQKRRQGRFEAAEGGTLFLDEIGLVSIPVQEKVLRAVEYGVFERVGSSAPVHVDVRIVGATNADLPELAAADKFKQDLLDRLSFDVLYLPPLRARREDIIYLAQHFAVSMAHELGQEDVPSFSSSAIDKLNAYAWPGNIRELKNVVERSVYRCGGGVISEIEFDPFVDPYRSEADLLSDPHPKDEENDSDPPLTLSEQVRDLELRSLKRALTACNYHQSQAASLLGLSYHQFRGLYRKYKDYLN